MGNYVTTRCTIMGPAPDVAAFRDRMIVWDERNEACMRLGFDSMPKMLINTPDGPMLAETLLAKGPPHMRFDFERIIPVPVVLKEVEESERSERGVCLMILRGERGTVFEPLGLREESVEEIRAAVNMPDEPMNEVAAAFLEQHPDHEEAARLRVRALAETGYPGWYSWKVVHWGTKTNSFSFRLIGEQPLEFMFDTIWKFPWPVFDALAREFPTLRFRCVSFEEFGHFGGEGWFNPPPGEQPYEYCEGTDQLYERVFGEKPKPARSRKSNKSPKIRRKKQTA